MSVKEKLLKQIGEAREESSKKIKFSGTLMDYVELVEKDPGIVKSAQRRLYESIEEHGEYVMPDSDSRKYKIFDGDNVKIYKYFENEFFGMENVTGKVMSFLHSAAHGGEESRQVLLFMGPVGAGKSALTEHIKKALDGKSYFHLKGDPHRGEPLQLIPRSLRPKFEEALGVKIDGDISPIARYKLLNNYQNKYEDFEVEETTFSQRGRRGVAAVPPMDANSQDISVLIGSVDISKLDKFAEDDPRALSLNGAFNVGNRGIVELVEVFKNEIEFLHTIITATQEKRVPSPGKSDMLHFDGVILAHCNEAEWNRFQSEHTNEAIMDRIVKINVPYCLELNQEMKIYQKMLGKSDFGAHIAPHTLKVASMFSIMSRLRPTSKCDLLTKMKIYNGEEVLERGRVRKVDIKDLREEAKHEGMDGISTRFITKAIDNALSTSDKKMVTPVSLMDSLVKMVKEQINDEQFKSHCLEILQKTVREEYLKILENEIAKAFVNAYDEQAQSIFNSYLDNAESYTTQTKLKDKVTKEERKPDETFMTAIEEQIGISGSAKDGFRSDVTAYMFSKMRRGEVVNHKSYQPLKEAIELYLINSVKGIARIVTKAKSRDDEQQKKYSDMVQCMISDYGYSADSAEEAIIFASHNLWRDS
jgi:serine protein kinase